MPDWGALMAQAGVDGRECVVGALFMDELGRVFVHRRSWDRRSFPACWDIVGGHVEAGEDLLAALEREIAEETGWQLRGSPQLIHVADWDTYAGAELIRRREFDFLVEINGDLSRPRLERGKHACGGWLEYSEPIPEAMKPASRLHEAIKRVAAIDEGTGSTFAAHADRGLVHVRVRGPDGYTHVRTMTAR